MDPIYDFNGQVTPVTGAARGMRLATARMFAEAVTAAVPWLCSPAARFAIGVGLTIDGGLTAH